MFHLYAMFSNRLIKASFDFQAEGLQLFIGLVTILVAMRWYVGSNVAEL
jgi:hypothetical protein